jgi:hypothetical protein
VGNGFKYRNGNRLISFVVSPQIIFLIELVQHLLLINVLDAYLIKTSNKFIRKILIFLVLTSIKNQINYKINNFKKV